MAPITERHQPDLHLKNCPGDWDFVVVGSGFGGSVAAYRLVRKGYSVLVVEEGRRYRPHQFPKTNFNLRKSLFVPWLGLRGILRLSFFRGLSILSGSGVGGGSLVYANTLITPKPESFRNGTWPERVGVDDWQKELEPHYREARRMLGVVKSPTDFAAERHIKAVADELGYGNTFRPVDVGVFLGEPGKTVADPYFSGDGPERTGCTFCGGCMVGCRVDAKNTLDKNYLFLAQSQGARVLPDTEVAEVAAVDDGYRLTLRRSGWGMRKATITARQVVVAAGVLGTLKLLFKCREQQGLLPKLSTRLGTDVRTNSESLLGVRKVIAPEDFSRGLAITCEVNPNDHTKIEGCRFPAGSNLIGLLSVPLRLGNPVAVRWAKVLFDKIFRPYEFLRFTSPFKWAKETIIVLTMQALDNKMAIKWRRKFPLIWQKSLVPEFAVGQRPPVLIPEGNDFAFHMADRFRGFAGGSMMDLAGQSVTAHILGGCPMGADRQSGVIDGNHEVHGYPGLYVLGGASVPANLGANPSLTITAMAERAMAKIPAKQS